MQLLQPKKGVKVPQDWSLTTSLGALIETKTRSVQKDSSTNWLMVMKPYLVAMKP